jgi:hypothetical protein
MRLFRSGGRDSNPRQHAWEAGFDHDIASGSVSKGVIWCRFLVNLIQRVLPHIVAYHHVWQQSWQQCQTKRSSRTSPFPESGSKRRRWRQGSLLPMVRQIDGGKRGAVYETLLPSELLPSESGFRSPAGSLSVCLSRPARRGRLPPRRLAPALPRHAAARR